MNGICAKKLKYVLTFVEVSDDTYTVANKIREQFCFSYLSNKFP